MKKLFIGLLFVLFLCTGAFAGQSIGNTIDTSVTTGQGYLSGIILHTDGSNSVTITPYDNTAASGTKLFSTMIITTASTNRTTTISFDPEECRYATGIYIDITTSGTVTYDVYFKSK